MFVFGDGIKAGTAFDELKRLYHAVVVEVGRCVAVADDALDGRIVGNQFLAQREDCFLLGRRARVLYLRSVGVGLVKTACIADTDGV